MFGHGEAGAFALSGVPIPGLPREPLNPRNSVKALFLHGDRSVRHLQTFIQSLHFANSPDRGPSLWSSGQGLCGAWATQGRASLPRGRKPGPHGSLPFSSGSTRTTRGPVLAGRGRLELGRVSLRPASPVRLSPSPALGLEPR